MQDLHGFMIRDIFERWIRTYKNLRRIFLCNPSEDIPSYVEGNPQGFELCKTSEKITLSSLRDCYNDSENGGQFSNVDLIKLPTKYFFYSQR